MKLTVWLHPAERDELCESLANRQASKRKKNQPERLGFFRLEGSVQRVGSARPRVAPCHSNHASRPTFNMEWPAATIPRSIARTL